MQSNRFLCMNIFHQFIQRRWIFINLWNLFKIYRLLGTQYGIIASCVAKSNPNADLLSENDIFCLEFQKSKKTPNLNILYRLREILNCRIARFHTNKCRPSIYNVSVHLMCHLLSMICLKSPIKTKYQKVLVIFTQPKFI